MSSSPPLTPHRSRIFYKSVSTYSFLSSSPSLSCYYTYTLRPFSQHVSTTLTFSLHVIFLVTAMVLPLLSLATCSFLVSSFVYSDYTHPSQHPHLNHIHACSLFSWFFVLDNVSAPHTNACLTCSAYSFPLASWASFYTTQHSTACTSSNFPMLHSVLSPHPYLRPPTPLSPRIIYLKLLTFSNHSLNVFNVCGFSLSACSNPHSIHCVFALSADTHSPLFQRVSS